MKCLQRRRNDGTRTNCAAAPVTVRFECPICGRPHAKADHQDDPGSDDARLAWHWITARFWDDCALCSATIEPGDVIAYRAVDGMLLDTACVERERLDPWRTKALSQQARQAAMPR